MTTWGTTGSIPDNQSINGGSFWPLIDTQPFYEKYRIPRELPANTVIDHLRLAIVRVRRMLKEWQAEQEAASLAEVEQEEVDGIGELTLLWERAVYCEAKAEILKETQTADRQERAENSAKSGEDTEDKYREFAADAVAAIQGQNSTTVVTI